MDITSVGSYRFARTRADLALAPGEVVLAGGTWLMSEPQPHTTGFVDISRMEWAPIEVSSDGLRVAANCTIARLVAWSRANCDDDGAAQEPGRTPDTFGECAGSSGNGRDANVPTAPGAAAAPMAPAAPAEWRALPMIEQAANALLASFKIWNTATVGGNICRSFAAAAMTSLAVGLDGVAEVWCPDGSGRWLPVAELITGNGTNSLTEGEILRSIWFPAYALRSTARLRKIALAEHGRSGSVVTGRLDEDGSAVFTITAATLTPQVLRFDELPDGAALASALEQTSGYYTDPLGAADWRRATSLVLAERIRDELQDVGVVEEVGNA
ncbi:MAG: FAD binding domain-containing protein [Ancrocorticia sp.]